MIRWSRRILTVLSTLLLLVVLTAWVDAAVNRVSVGIGFRAFDRGGFVRVSEHLLEMRNSSAPDSGWQWFRHRDPLPEPVPALVRVSFTMPTRLPGYREVPLWIVVLALAVLPTVTLARRGRRRWRLARGICACGYDLRGTTGA